MANGKRKANGGLLPVEEFVRRAILNLRNPAKSKGIHSVYSGFNAAFKAYYGKDPVAATNKLAKEGKIVIIPRKGGVMLYLPEDAPKSDNAKKALSKILGA